MIGTAMRVALSCVIVACGLLAATPAQARTEVFKTQAGSVVHWNAVEITVAIDAATTPAGLHPLDIVSAMERAIRVWNRIPADQPRFRLTVAGEPDVSVRFCRGAWQGDAVDLGRTEFRAHPLDGRVTAATVELNACDHGFTASVDETIARYDLQSVLSHELGHVLGLGHSTDRAAIMFPNGRGVSIRTPSADDETALAIIYLGREPTRPRTTATATTAVTAGSPIQAAVAAPPEEPPKSGVSLLKVARGDGRQLTVYTEEPSLLPPIAGAAAAGTSRPPGHPGRKRR